MGVNKDVDLLPPPVFLFLQASRTNHEKKGRCWLLLLAIPTCAIFSILTR